MLSIIIPTLNEEKYLPLLLDSIKKQDFKDYEIIVADAGSEDRTIEIAKRDGCMVIKGGMPAKGRNEGVKVAKGDLLLFLDADIILPKGFLEKVISDVKEKNISIGTFPIILHPAKKFDKFISKFYNIVTDLTKSFLAHAAGGVLLATKKIHEKINGFDESILLAEDYDYARRAQKFVRFEFLRTSPVLYSNRRFKKEGYIKSCIKYVLIELYIIFFGPIRSDIFNYKFSHYEEKGGTKK